MKASCKRQDFKLASWVAAMQGVQYRAVQVAIPATTPDSKAALTLVCPYINTKEKQKKKREQGKAAGQACKGHLRSTGCGGKFLLLGRKVAHVLATTDTCLLHADPITLDAADALCQHCNADSC